MRDKVVVVTGGGRGIGRAVCRRFAAAGAQVVAVARSGAELQETRAQIESEGGRCHPLTADICQADEIAELITDTIRQFGGVHVLVNNAGVAPLSRVEELDPSLFEALQTVNVDAVYHACRAVWGAMTRQGDGVIISLSSMASVDPFPGFTAYGASKAWVNAWTRGLADEGRPHNIRVFAVAPGAVETKMLRDAFPDFPAERALEPGEVADVVHSLAQPACKAASGQTVFVKK